MIKLSYTAQEERDSLYTQKISEGLILIEEMNVLEGNFLIFNTEQPARVPTPEERLQALELAMLDVLSI